MENKYRHLKDYILKLDNANEDKEYYELLRGSVKLPLSSAKTISVNNDDIFGENASKQIGDRDVEYTKLLSHFVKITKVRTILREIFKWIFYITIICSVIAVSVVTINIVNKFINEATINELTKGIPLLITSLVGLISTIIVIPLVITKYLFSTKEDDNITSIILHTQEHDTTGRQWVMKYKNKNNNKRTRQ